MTRRLRYMDAALDDLNTIALHVAEQSADGAAAEAFVEKLRERCRRLAGLPGVLGTPRPELQHDIRSTPAGNYVIFFRYQQDVLEIVNVLNGHRDIDGYFAS